MDNLNTTSNKLSYIIDHPLFDRQVELEETMRSDGIKRFRDAWAKRADKRGLSETRAVNRLVVTAHDKMVEEIKAFLTKPGAGRKHVAKGLIEMVGDVDVVANLTARGVLDGITREASLSVVAFAVAGMIEDEVNSRRFKEAMPRAWTKFHEKAKKETLDRRKWSHLLFPARLLGVELVEWSPKDHLLLGTKLVEMFAQATGLVTVKLLETSKGDNKLWLVIPNAATLSWIEEENKRLEMLFPVYMPTLIPPRPWTSPTDGGYWTRYIRSLNLVKSNNKAYLEELSGREMPEVYAAVNALQDTAWQINKPVLEVMNTLFDAGSGLAKLPLNEREELPPKLWWMDQGIPKEELTEEQQAELADWKARAAQVHKRNAEQEKKRLQFARMVGVANTFAEEEEFYFPHQLDWRGRAYPIPLYLHPQGNDMQRGLLTFASTVAITDQVAADWLAIHGAGVWGYDKVSLEERVRWVYDNEAMIIASAENPYDCRWWMDADKGEKPWQFLAFCFEWAGFRKHGFGYESSLPVQMDGTCNGLQNFSAMLLDPIGGAAVNLIPSDKPQDIYAEVAKLVSARVAADAMDGDPIALGWHGKVTRSVTKRPVMTLAYGARQFGFVKQVEEDTIAEWRGKDDYPFVFADEEGKDRDFGYKAAQYMGKLIWESVGEVVVAARHAMDWLQDAARVAAKEQLPVMWTTPTNFMVQQAYRVPNVKRLETTFNAQRLTMNYQVGAGKIDSRRQAAGISPNWVHSLDASHLMKTLCAATEEGMSSFSMIHDSYGTHAGNAGVLADILRHQFVQMYAGVDVLSRFKEELENQIDGEPLPELPPKGSLDLNKVLESPFFFA
jgi:DNA-directed RNA polymerase